MTEELEMIIFTIVGNAGEAKSLAQEALNLSFEGKFEESEEQLKKANEAILRAHAIQTDLIQKEAGGEPTPINMLFVHAQDHLMTAISEKTLIQKMILQNKKIFNLEKISIS